MSVQRPATFLGNVITVLKGSVTAQLIGVAVLPLLTRLFTPEAFGTYQLYLMISTFVLVVAAMRYEVALLRVASDEDAARLMALCAASNCAVASAVAVASGASLWWQLLPADVEPALLMCLGPATLLLGLAQTFSYIAVRNKRYGANARSKVYQSCGFAAAGLAAGQAAAGGAGLLIADIAGRFASLFALWRLWPVRLGEVLTAFRESRTRELARLYREFPLVAVPSGLISAAGTVTTPLFIFAAFDLATAGQYSLVERCVMVPIGLVTQAVSQVFNATFAESVRERRGDARALLRAVVVGHLKLGLLPTAIMAIAAPTLFAVVFGEQWRLAGQFAQLMSPLFLMAFLVAPIHMALTVLGRQRAQLAWDSSKLVGVVATWSAVIHWQLEPATALLLHTSVNFLFYLAYLLIAFRECARARV